MAAAPSAEAGTRTILVVGDSLSAEYGLPRGTGWVRLLSDRVAIAAPQYSVVNASISGDTTSGGRARLPALLAQHKPAIVVLELGANDGLRGLSTDAMRANLAEMIDACRAAHASVLLVGIHVPPNYGSAYGDSFYAVYTTLAKARHVAFAPFLFDGFAERLDWFQGDRLHPLPRAQARMLDNVWPYLEPLLAPRS